MISINEREHIEIIDIENEDLKVSVVPSMGGKIISVYNKKLGKEFLWRNNTIPFARHEAGSEYDPNFIGGIDELIPNDIPETIDGIIYPDHGELWTTPLDQVIDGDALTVYGILPLSGLYYSKTIILSDVDPSIVLNYTIRNDSDSARHFMWKLHAAMHIESGDRLVTPALYGKVADPEYCRFKKELKQFRWPLIENTDASVIAESSNAIDFFYLYGHTEGYMQLHSNNGEHIFGYEYDPAVFPFQWWFASYGGFLDHYTAVLEPCTNMPISVNEAAAKNQCAVLDPGASLTTRVRIFAGEKNDYLSL